MKNKKSKSGNYRYAYCKCGENLNRITKWVSKYKAICTHCGEDLTEIVSEKRK